MTDNKFGIMRPRSSKKTKPDRPSAKHRVVDTVVASQPRAEATVDEIKAEVSEDLDLEATFAKVEVVVNGVRIRISKLRTQEHVGLLLAEATREQADAQAHYRAWRARKGIQIVTRAGKELAEWRVRQLVESEPDYLTYQTALSRATANVIALRTVFDTWGDE